MSHFSVIYGYNFGLWSFRSYSFFFLLISVFLFCFIVVVVIVAVVSAYVCMYGHLI